jgi:hypothetical protein
MATCAWNLRKWLVWYNPRGFYYLSLFSRPLKTHSNQTKTTHFANHPNQQNCFLSLKGQVGDEINVLMAICAWNLRKWLVIATIFLFWQKLGLFFVMAAILDTGRG